MQSYFLLRPEYLIFSIILAGSTSSIAYLLDPAIEKIFINYEIKITSHILTFKNTPYVLAKEVSGFFYASLVLSSKDYCVLVSKLTDYFNNISVDGLSNFNLPVNRLVVRKN